MAQSGSILGNCVLRKEDPGLLTGANKYFDDLKVDGIDAHRVRPLPRRPRPTRRHRHGRGEGDARRARRVHGRRPRPARQRRLRRRAGAQAPAAGPGQGPLRRRHRRRRGRRPIPTSPPTRPRPSSSTTTRCPRSIDLEESLAGRHAAVRGQGHATSASPPPTARTSTPSAAPTSSPRPASSASASPACPWSRTAASPSPRATASRFYVPTQAPHGVQPACRRPRPRSGAGAGHRPWVGGGFGPKAGGLRRVHRRRRGRPGARPAGEVDRDPHREHALDGPRPQLHHGRQARRQATTARSSGSRPRSSPTAAPTRQSASCCRCSPR